MIRISETMVEKPMSRQYSARRASNPDHQHVTDAKGSTRVAICADVNTIMSTQIFLQIA
jgi:hypothetical protein